MIRLIPLALALGWCPLSDGDDGRGDDSVGAVFQANRDALLVEGVHRVQGVVFATTRLRFSPGAGATLRQIKKEEAATLALGEILRFRINECLRNGYGSESFREVLVEVGGSCVATSFPIIGAVRVWAKQEEEAVVVVQAVPAESLDLISVEPKSIQECLTARVDAGTVPPMHALVLRELEGPKPEDPEKSRRRLVVALSNSIGAGIEVGLSKGWASADGLLCVECMRGWTDVAAKAVAATGTFGDYLSPLSEEVIGRLSLDDLLSLLAQRVHDPAVEQAVSARLRDAGFACAADDLSFSKVPLHPPVDPQGGAVTINHELRARVVASPVVMVLLLTDGVCGLEWERVLPRWFGEAKAAFDGIAPQGRDESIRLIANNLGRVPNVEAISLLSAALIDAGDATLAEPLARGAFFAAPTHEFAGINALRAARALGKRERAQELFPRVASEAILDEWGRAQLAEIATWLEVPASDSPQPEPSVPPSSGTAKPPG
jgi:hypothetical protein